MVRLRLVQVEEGSRVLLNPRTGDLVEFAPRVVQEYEGEQFPLIYKRGRIHRMQSTREGISFILSLNDTSRIIEIKPSEILEIQGIEATWSEEHHGFILKDDGRRLTETTPEEANDKTLYDIVHGNERGDRN
jgi:hypothetical protein